jgi:DNA-binding response OmpR family regulator
LLVIHPHPAVPEPWGHALLALGCPVDVATDGEAALEHLLAGSPTGRHALLLIVETGPPWRARDILQSLRRLPLRRQLPVLVIGGEDRELSSAASGDCEVNPANAYLPTPAKADDLLLMLGLLLGRPASALYRLGKLLPGALTWPDQAHFDRALAVHLRGLWRAQQESLCQADPAAGTVAAASGVLEHLLANRLDAGAMPAARALTQLAGGPRPLAHWAAEYAPPAPRLPVLAPPSPAMPPLPIRPAQALLLIRLGPWQVGVPVDRIGSAFRHARPEQPDAAAADAGRPSADGPGPVALGALLGWRAFRDVPDEALWLDLQLDGECRVATPIDDVIGYAMLVCQPLSPQIRRLSGLLGTAVLEDGSTVLLPDLGRLARRARPALETPPRPAALARDDGPGDQLDS